MKKIFIILGLLLSATPAFAMRIDSPRIVGPFYASSTSLFDGILTSNGLITAPNFVGTTTSISSFGGNVGIRMQPTVALDVTGTIRANSTVTAVIQALSSSVSSNSIFRMTSKDSGGTSQQWEFKNQFGNFSLTNTTPLAQQFLGVDTSGYTILGNALMTPVQPAEISIAGANTSIATMAIVPPTSTLGDILRVYGRTDNLTDVINKNNNWGLGTTSPYAKLSVMGQIVGTYITATSSTNTSSFTNVLHTGSTTLQNFTGLNSTTTNATTTSLSIGSLNGLLKAVTGSVTTATAGSDYENPLTFSAPLSRSVNTISIPVATSIVSGYLSNTNWSTFNNKSDFTTLGPTGQGQTGVSQVLATTTNGTDFTITSAGNIHSFNLPVASSVNTGKLSSTDWSTFNGKQSALTFLYPLVNTANTITSDFGTTTTIGVGTSKLLSVNSSGVIVASSTIGNSQLQNSSITVTTASPLGGAGTYSLGGTIPLTCTGCLTSLAGAASSTLLADNNTWTGSNNYTSNVYLGTAGGNVGIGTTSPQNKLEVSGIAVFNVGQSNVRPGTGLYVYPQINNTVHSWSIGANSPIADAFTITPSVNIGSVSSPTFVTPSLTILASGLTGIGTTSPAKTLSVGGDLMVGASSAGGTAGNVTLLGNLSLIPLATPAGSFLAVNTLGQVIATSSPSTNFSTTSADYWKTTNNFFSTTSTDYWKTTNNFFSTTSADYWKTVNNFFSTTSADYWKTANNFFSTTSTDYWKTTNNFFSTTSTDYWKTTNNFFSTTSTDYWKTANNFFSTTSADYWGTTKNYITLSSLSGTYPIIYNSGTGVISSGFGTSTTIGVGTDKLLSVNSSGVIVASSTIGNSQLQNSSITVNTTAPLGGGGAVSLGGTLNVTCTGCLTSAITTLGDIFHTGLTGATQTFSTSTADTNLGMTIVSSGTTHLFTPYWIGTLADNRIASSATWNAKNGWAYPFTATSYGNSTSTIIGFTGGMMSTASSTFTNFTFNTATGTSATTTNLFSSNLFGTIGNLGNLLVTSSTTLQNFTAVNSTTTNATTTTLGIGTLNGLLKGINGSVTTATAGTDYGSVSSIATNNGLTGGTITTTGTIGLNTAGFSTNSLVSWNGSNLVATGTPQLTVGNIVATTTANSTFAGNVGIGNTSPTEKLSIGNNTAQTTAMIYGLNSANGSPVLAYVRGNAWYTGMPNSTDLSFSYNIASYSDANILSASKMYLTGSGNVGIGTTSPYSTLSVVGTVVASNLVATSTTATSTFAASVSFGTNFYNAGAFDKKFLLYESANIHNGWSLGAGAVGTEYRQFTNGTGAGTNALVYGYANNSTGVFNEVMRIREDGKVGIGINAPITKVHISGATTGESLGLHSSVSHAYLGAIGGSDNSVFLGNNAYYQGTTWYNDTNAQTSSLVYLDNVGGLQFYSRASSGTPAYGTLRFAIAAGGTITFSSAIYASCAGFTSNASGVVACTPSDKRLKENIISLSNNIDLKMMKLNPVSFYFKDKEKYNDKKQYGLIAQDVEKIFPDLVQTGSPTKEAPDGIKQLNYNGFTGLIIEWVQHLVARVSGLESRLNNQELRIQKLELLLNKK